MKIDLRETPPLIPTKAHARFVEFADACAEYRYIGVCHGRPGVGKTRSAQEYAAWSGVYGYSVREALTDEKAATFRACRAIFYTAAVSNTPKSIDATLGVSIFLLGHARLILDGRHDSDFCLQNARRACPLLIVDEADRLVLKSLEHLRHIHDQFGFGVILLGMPGLEKRLARYPQLYSRVGFVHEFKPLSAEEMRFIITRHGETFGIRLDLERFADVDALAAITRITRGNFRLMERLFAQTRRVMALNGATEPTAEIVQAARDCLVIGPSD